MTIDILITNNFKDTFRYTLIHIYIHIATLINVDAINNISHIKHYLVHFLFFMNENIVRSVSFCIDCFQ